MDAAPYATIQAAALVESTAPLRWLVDGLFIEAGAGILGGAPKSCKSFFALDLAVAIASGTPCAGSFCVAAPGPVVLLCAEDPHEVLCARLAALARGRGLALATLPIEVITEPAVRLPEGLGRLAATLRALAPRLLLLDPLIRLHRADENSASEMSVILDGLRELARHSRSAVLLVHHARKAAAASGGAGLRGSSDLHAFGDSNLYLKRLSQDGALELKVEHRAAASRDPLRLKLEVDDDASCARFAAVVADERADPLAERVFDLLTGAAAPLSAASLRSKLGVRNQAVANAIKTLEGAGRIRRQGRDGWASATPV